MRCMPVLFTSTTDVSNNKFSQSYSSHAGFDCPSGHLGRKNNAANHISGKQMLIYQHMVYCASTHVAKPISEGRRDFRPSHNSWKDIRITYRSVQALQSVDPEGQKFLKLISTAVKEFILPQKQDYAVV